MRQMVLKCLHIAQIGRPDISGTVHALARATTLEHSVRQKVGDTDKLSQLHLGLSTNFVMLETRCSGIFHNGDVGADSNSTPGGQLCIFDDHTFVSIAWEARCRRQCHLRSTESEVISLDPRFRMEGLLL